MPPRRRGFRYDVLPQDPVDMDFDQVLLPQQPVVSDSSSDGEGGGFAYEEDHDDGLDNHGVDEWAFDALHQGPDAWLDAQLLHNADAVGLVEFTHSAGVWLRAGGVADVAPGHLQQAANTAELEHGEAVIVMPAYLYEEDGALFGAAASAEVERRRRLTDPAAHADRAVQAGRLSPLSFVTIRAVSFRDGIGLCSCCNNPGCNRSLDDARLFERELQTPEQPDRAYTNVFGERAPLCRCACAALKLVAGGTPTASPVLPYARWLANEQCPVWAWYRELPEFGAPLLVLHCNSLCNVQAWC